VRGWKHASVAVLAFALVLAGSSAAASSSPDRILVKFRPGTSAQAEAAINSRHGGTVVGEIAQLGVRIVRISSNASDAAQAYAGEGAVEYAEPDAEAQATETPNDPGFSSEWGMSKIQAPAAWGISHGSASVAVAVLDTGISASHPDLAGKIVKQANFSSSATLDDVFGHGTHVAGIAAAVTNNAVGVAGLGWNTSLMNVKVLGDNGFGSYSAIAQGITWAADNGAQVINMSLSGTTASSTLESAVNYAWSKGVVVSAAAGNNGSSAPVYPAYYANAIAVAATDTTDHLASFSNFGSWVDVAAPGVNVYSTYPGGGYASMSGTSMAAPHVAGEAALLFATLADTNRDGALNDEVRACIETSADNVGLPIGGGRIDAYRALSGCSTAPATGAISGTVTDAATHAAIAGATVSNGQTSTTTGNDGTYTLGNLPAGSYTVSVSAAGYAGASQVVSVTANQTTSSVNFALTKPTLWASEITFAATGTKLRTTVRLQASDGAVAGVVVTLAETWNGSTTKTFSGTTGGSGTVTFVWQKAQRGTYVATLTGLSSTSHAWDHANGVLSATFTF
jgi:thermitase